MPSEVAELRKRIQEEYESSMLGLCGYAITARHDFVYARLRQVDKHCVKLAEIVGEEKAIDTVICINDEIVEKYKNLVRLFLHEEEMKGEAPLRTYQATSLEMMAIGYIILHHLHNSNKNQQTTQEEYKLTIYAQSFFDRLMTQLPEVRPLPPDTDR